jgi:hypothetical protein
VPLDPPADNPLRQDLNPRDVPPFAVALAALLVQLDATADLEPAGSPRTHVLEIVDDEGDARINPQVTVSWSPDARLLASAERHDPVRLWSADGQPVHELTGHTLGVRAVAWSPDGQLLAAANHDNGVEACFRDAAHLSGAGWFASTAKVCATPS